MRLTQTIMTFSGRITGAVAAGLTAAFLAASPVAAIGKTSPFAMEDDSWVTISGTVESVNPDTFTLDYGDGSVIVEMDDGDRDSDAYKLLAGDEVTVSGAIDDDFYETTKIEASSVYVDKIGTTFFASAIDEENREPWTVAVTVPLASSEAIVYGTVTDVDENEFTVDSGLSELRVDVNEMIYNPLDDEGYQKVSIGDRVKVKGPIDSTFFEGRELDADSVIKLNAS